MKQQGILKNDENAIIKLRSLYQKYGYAQYKMNKFEEYDLYVKNKDFLVSENVITFTDTNGKLLALKPDVTLSIINNYQETPHQVQKVYYNENVYRVSKNTHLFKEIMQSGLECIGDVDTYNICEVLMLAARSLAEISEDFVLDISHMGVISAILDGVCMRGAVRDSIIKCISEKNIHDMEKICAENGIEKLVFDSLSALVQGYGEPTSVINGLKKLSKNEKMTAAITELEEIVNTLKQLDMSERINIDFSIINDMNYYNGVVFKGYVSGMPVGILSGGQYDNLMHKMGKNAGAIGFAVYLDLLERLGGDENKYDVDTVLIYDEKSSVSDIISAVKMLTANGQSVIAEKSVPGKIKYRQLLKLEDRGVKMLEENG